MSNHTELTTLLKKEFGKLGEIAERFAVVENEIKHINKSLETLTTSQAKFESKMETRVANIEKSIEGNKFAQKIVYGFLGTLLVAFATAVINDYIK